MAFSGIVKTGTVRADKLAATANNTTLNGLAGDDTLTSGSYADVVLNGGDGNDTFIAKIGDVINGGSGVNTVQFWTGVSSSLANEHLVGVQNVVITNSTNASYDFSQQTEALKITGGKANDVIQWPGGRHGQRRCGR